MRRHLKFTKRSKLVVGMTLSVAIFALAIVVLASGGQSTARAKVRSVCTPENTSGCPGNAQLEKLSPTRTTEGSTTHTPEEEARNKSLEAQRGMEKERAATQKVVEEHENSSAGKYDRHIEEKVCYESGKTSEECKGNPLKETPQEERANAENKARQRQGQEERTGEPAVVE